MVHTSSFVSDLKKFHLDGSRLFDLHNLSNAIKTISEHSISCGVVVELIGEVQWNGLASRILAHCPNVMRNFCLVLVIKLYYTIRMGKKGIPGLTMQQQ